MEKWQFFNSSKSLIISGYLKTHMLENNIKTADIADYMGMNKTTLSNKLNGHNTIRLGELEKICEYLNIDVNEILSLLGNSVKNPLNYEEYVEIIPTNTINNKLQELTPKLIDCCSEFLEKENKDVYDVRALSLLVNSICNLVYGGKNNG